MRRPRLLQLVVEQAEQLGLAVFVAISQQAREEVRHDVLPAVERDLPEVGQDY